MPTTYTRWKLGFTLSLMTAVLWGLLPIALKGLLEVMDAVTITWYRFVSAAIVLALLLLLKLGFPKLKLLRGRILVLVIICIVGLTYNYVCYLLGLKATTPSSAQVMIQLAPMLLLIGGLVIFKENFSRWQWLGLSIFIVGIGCFFNHRWAEVFHSFDTYTIGILWVVLAAVLWAAYALTQKTLLSKFTSFEIMFFIYGVGSFILLPNASPSQIADLNAVAIGLLIFCCLNTLFAYGAFAEALAHWEASRVSAVLSMTPLLTIVFMHLTHHFFANYKDLEPLNTLSIAGAILVVIGSMLTALANRI